MIKVIASLQFKPEKREEFIAGFRRLVPHVLREEGCIDYGLFLDADPVLSSQPPCRDDVITVLETWESPEALKKHVKTPHFVEFIESSKDMLVGITAQVLKPDKD